MKVFDFFSGCGGTSQGFSNVGFDIAFALDYDKDSTDTFKTNFPGARVVHSDIRSYQPDLLADLIGNRAVPILFSGCAPCQPFSKQNNNKKKEDSRVNLLSEFERFVIFWRPDYIVVENVPGLQKVERSPVLQKFKSTLDDLGYQHSSSVIRCSDFGIPQRRERFILVAALNQKPLIPVPTHGVGKLPYSTVADWIFDLPELKDGETCPDDKDHQSSKLSLMNLKRIRATPEGGDRSSWSSDLILECHKRHMGHTDVYGRLSWNKPASGLTTRCISYSNGRFGHPVQDRALSLREAALLQTFPKEFKFSGSLSSRARQVGNAVPPLMAEVIAKSLIGD